MKEARFRMSRFQGVCMWPGLQEGDLLIYFPLAEAEVFQLAGQIAVAGSPAGPVAHRIRRVFGEPGREWLVLGGDLSESDAPRRREDVLGVAKALYRPGLGFVDLPKPLDLGPIGRALLQRLGRFFTWAQNHASVGALTGRS